MSVQPLSVDDTLRFVLAGNAYFTLVSVTTQNRFTYRVRQCEDKPELYFVSVLTGADNESDYTYFGTIYDADGPVFKFGKKSRIGKDAQSVRAFEWWMANMDSDKVEVYHEGRCGRCGRKLTVPESVQNGLGPECIKYFS